MRASTCPSAGGRSLARSYRPIKSGRVLDVGCEVWNIAYKVVEGLPQSGIYSDELGSRGAATS